MIHTLKLLLPALIPSWRFFDWIAASPRIEVAILKTPKQTVKDWQEFRPRPSHVSFATMAGRMIWNPNWNDTLFLVSCAERLAENYTDHSHNQILKRIMTDHPDAPYIQFRLIFISREGDQLQKETRYVSKIHACHKDV